MLPQEYLLRLQNIFMTSTIFFNNIQTMRVQMKNLSILTSSLEDVMNKAELIENLLQRVAQLENALKILQGVAKESWVSLEKAATEIGKSESAIRQIVKNPKKKMAKGKVWKQECKGASIYINLKEYRKAI
jgi:uncharacterized protein YoxC